MRHTLYILVFLLFCCVRGEAQTTLPYTLSSFSDWCQTNTSTPDHVWQYGHITSSTSYSNLPTNESYFYISDKDVNNNGVPTNSGRLYSVSQNFNFFGIDKPVISFKLYYHFGNINTSVETPSFRITCGTTSYNKITLKEWINDLDDQWEYVSICCDGSLSTMTNAQINIEVESYSSVDYYIAIKDFKITGFKISSITPHNTSCYGYNDGSIDVEVAGAGPNYAYSTNGTNDNANWIQAAPNTNTFTYDNLMHNTYHIAIKDVTSGCIIEPSPVTVQSDHDIIRFTHNVVDVTCYDKDNGSIDIRPGSGSYSDYAYSVDNGVTYQDEHKFEHLASATYNIKVKTKDAAACESQSQSVDIGSSVLLRINEVIPTHITTCYGNNEGAFKVKAESKVGAIKYHFECNGTPYPGNTFGQVYDLPAGLYNISIEDANGCILKYDNNPVEITQPPLLEFKGYSSTDVVGCNGDATGSIEINVPEGGSGGYKYSIDGVNYESERLYENLIGDYQYKLSVCDKNNCKTAITYTTLSQPTKVKITNVQSSDVTTCNGDNTGSITITATGGTGDISYSVVSDVFQASNVFNVGAGTYYPKVQDAEGCPAEWKSVKISEPDVVKIDYIDAPAKSIKCNGQPTGKILVRAIGGTAPYTILLNNMTQSDNVPTATNYHINNLYADTYTVQIEDLHHCKSLPSSVTIEQPDPITIAIEDPINATCKGVKDASVRLVAVGGTTQYTYAYKRTSVGSYSTSPNPILTLYADTYHFKIIDANGCESPVLTQQLTEPEKLVPTIIPHDVATCYNDKDGSIEVKLTGGTAPYKYAIGSGDYIETNNNTYTFTNLGKGHYDIRVDDHNNCSGEVYRSYYVSGPEEITISSFSQESVKGCKGESKGMFKFAASGGFGKLTFSKDGDDLANFVDPPSPGYIVFNNLPAGTYHPWVKDARNCKQAVQTVVITEPEEFKLVSQKATDATCFGATNGSAVVAAEGGKKIQLEYPYYFYLDDATVVNNYTGEFKQLGEGTHTFTIKDDYGCTLTGSFYIGQPDELKIIQRDLTDVTTCNGDRTGAITVKVTGGTAPYNYSASGYNYSAENTTGEFTEMPASGYELLITDKNQCFVDSVVTLTQPDPLRYSAKITNNIKCHNEGGASFEVTATGGIEPYWYSFDNGDTYPYNDGSYVTFTDVKPGMYYVKAMDSKGCTHDYKYEIEIINPPVLEADYEKYDVICNTGNTGKILSSAKGGTKPYKFSLDENEWKYNAGVFSNLTDSVYSVTVQDGHGCSVKLEGIELSRPPNIAGFTLDKYEGCSPLQVTITQDNDGGLTTYDISDGVKLYDCTGPTKYTFTNQSGQAQTYTIKATMMQAGGVGCTDTASVNLTVLSQPITDVRITNSSAVFPETTAYFANMSQNITSAKWDFGDGNISEVIEETSHTYEHCGNYNIILVQSDGICSDTAIMPFVIEGRPVHALMKANITQGCQPITVDFADASSNSDSCVWDFGDGTTSKAPKPTHKFEGAGDYQVSLTAYGDCGAASTSTKTIHVYPKPTAGFEQNADTLYEGQYLVASSLSSGSDYYLWDFGDGHKSEDKNPRHKYEFGGSFTISLVVTTSNSCSDTALVKNAVTVIENPIVVFPNAFTPNGDGINDIFKPVHGDIANFKIVILNKQGQIMYRGTDIEEGWDGTRNGHPCPTGVYVYKANIVLRDKSFYELKGYIVLLRLSSKK